MSVTVPPGVDNASTFAMDTTFVVKDVMRFAFTLNMDLSALEHVYLPLCALLVTILVIYLCSRNGGELFWLILRATQNFIAAQQPKVEIKQEIHENDEKKLCNKVLIFSLNPRDRF